MIQNYDQSVKVNHHPNWLYICNHLYRIFIIGGSGSGTTDVLLNLIKHQGPDSDNIYLYLKGQLQSKYQLLIHEIEKIGIENFEIQ